MAAYRFCFRVCGVSKFLSHLDIIKLFNRALMRAALPVAYSEGFNPHPRLTFGPPRSVGIEGLAEWGELQLKEELPPEEVLRRLNAALPGGVQLQKARRLSDEPRPALMAEINQTAYAAEVFADEQELSRLAAAIEEFWAADKVEIVRHHPKKGDKTIDLKAGVDKLCLQGNTLLWEIPFREGGSVKPTEVLRAVLPPGAAYKAQRTGLYIVGADGVRREP